MKGIILNEGAMIVRELDRSVNRNTNRMVIEMEVAPRFGQVVTEELYRRAFRFYFQVEKNRHPGLWTRLKDSTNDEFIEEFATFLNEACPLKKAFDAEKEKPITRLAIQEVDPETGEEIIWYKDEDEEAFNLAAARTAHEPTEVAQPNSYEVAMEDLKSRYPVEGIEDSLDLFIDLGVDGRLTTENI